MSDEFLGEVHLFAGDYVPRGWMICDGRALNIREYAALYSLLGTSFGGDGTTNFCIPDLRGRAPVGVSPVPLPSTGRSARAMGARDGSETVTLTTDQIPAHTHAAPTTAAASLQVSMTQGSLPQATPDAYLAEGFYQGAFASHRIEAYAPASSALSVELGGGQVTGVATVAASGGGQPHQNMQPSLALTYMICVLGVYPNRPD